MSAVLVGGGETVPAGGLLDPDVEGILEEKNQLISRQYAEIERLQRELAEVVGERDALLCEVSKFKFEREMTDLKRLHDDRYALLLFPLAFAFSVAWLLPLVAVQKEGRNEESHSPYTCTLQFSLLVFFPASFRFKRGKCNSLKRTGLTAMKIHFYRRESAFPLATSSYIFLLILAVWPISRAFCTA